MFPFVVFQIRTLQEKVLGCPILLQANAANFLYFLVLTTTLLM